MQSTYKSTETKNRLNNSQSFVPSEWLLSLMTPPLLITLVGGRVVFKLVQDFGLVSEEVFRGDRLLTLNQPLPTNDSESTIP
ncbi:MAG: hypothetical protein KME16_23430 [Scytolyngbya sp. HA4215-MV1]|jgi:hypothetical protein|nr:hypothetical protein [Scytolyngbya sp. HA4215-MV1]